MRLTAPSVTAFVTATVILSGCTTPTAYRPEVDAFQQAATEVNTFMHAKQGSVTVVRNDLRTRELEAKRPLLMVGPACGATLQKLNNDQTLTPEEVSACNLRARDDAVSQETLSPGQALDNSAEFAEAVLQYADALQQVSTASDKDSFVAAVDALGDAAGSVAESAAKAAGRPAPDTEALGPIAGFVAQAAYYYLENKRQQALVDGAESAHPWIIQGSEAVAGVLNAAQFELADSTYQQLLGQLDTVNEASPSTYVAAADLALATQGKLRSELAADPAAPFRKLPTAHEKLLAAFRDRTRGVAPSIAAAKALYAAAKEAQTALSKD